MINFTLKQLGYFEAVASLGGIAQAARQLNVSASAISTAISKLEASTGLSLFSRHTAKGVVLTVAGREFLLRAKQLLQHGEQVSEEARALASDEAGRIRFGCYAAFAPILGPGVVTQHRSNWPAVKLEFHEDTREHLTRDLLRGRLDCALLYDQGLDKESLDVEPLLTVRPRVALSADHPLALQSEVSLRDLQGVPYVLAHEPRPGPHYLDLLKDHGIEPEIALVSRSYEMLRSCVGRNMGFTLMAFQPPHTLTYQGDSIVALPIGESVPGFDVVLAWSKGRENSRLLRRFHAFCRDVVKAELVMANAAVELVRS
ncbi:LysR family transcriptional regulator [Pelagibius sp. Alg239-R121]|uniref:LysR family transcriptional regulator n=1 Tax=Pelagibius sp. Alg239-R121 TaxID=2993448 RepID=UPI0024A72234|nr:LysR family transcriptional regulator [Pelagibius sp. Alg239-R121]